MTRFPSQYFLQKVNIAVNTYAKGILSVIFAVYSVIYLLLDIFLRIMKLFYPILTVFCATIGLTSPVIAQETNIDSLLAEDMKPLPPKKFYIGNSLDGGIFSTSISSKPGTDKELTTLRFTYFINFGFDFNYDFTNHFGAFTGIGIKNIGFIEKFPALDSTVKRRVYTLGVPVGLKFGNLNKRFLGFIGGGADLALNYREKGFIKRGDKEKFNEWFSDRTELIMPYVFAGVSVKPGITFKLQYYPQNFFNTDYTMGAGTTVVKPYAGYTTNLILLSLGMDIHYNKKPKEQFDNVKGQM